MRSLGERLNRLRQLLNLRCGPGAAILPSNVTRIHMDFAKHSGRGHMGPKKFWRDHLSRLKYHNPSVPMILNRHDNSHIPPLMTIYFRNNAEPAAAAEPTTAAEPSPAEPLIQPSSSRTNLSPAQPPGPHERIVHIDMKDRHSTAILELFLAETRAKPLQPTKEDIAEMRYFQRLEKEAAVDRERELQKRAEQKKEADMLKRAREAGGLGDREELE